MKKTNNQSQNNSSVVPVHKVQAVAVRINQAHLTKAFLGELVKQDPNGESASMHLDKIRRVKREENKSNVG